MWTIGSDKFRWMKQCQQHHAGRRNAHFLFVTLGGLGVIFQKDVLNSHLTAVVRKVCHCVSLEWWFHSLTRPQVTERLRPERRCSTRICAEPADPLHLWPSTLPPNRLAWHSKRARSPSPELLPSSVLAASLHLLSECRTETDRLDIRNIRYWETTLE